MFTVSTMWFVLLRAAQAKDLGAWLTAEAESDAAVADKCGCWCKEIQEIVSGRTSAAQTQIRQLESSKNSQYYRNQQLRLEVANYEAQVNEHSDSLGTAKSLATRASSDHQDEQANTEAALKGVRKAIDAVPEGTNSRVHGALRTLEDHWEGKLQELKDEHETRQSQFQGLHETKSEMLRLAKEGAATRQQRLSEGLAEVAEASGQIDAYGAQQQADGSLGVALKDLCSKLADDATKRKQKRQEAVIAVSEARAAEAEQAAMHSRLGTSFLGRASRSRAAGINSNRTGISLLHSAARVGHSGAAEVGQRHTAVRVDTFQRGNCDVAQEHAEFDKQRAEESLESARKSAADLMHSVDRGQEMQQALGQMLHGMTIDALNAQNSGNLSPKVKAAVSELFGTAQAQLSSLSASFDAVRAKGRESSLEDHKLVTELTKVTASAAEALIRAKECTDV